MIGTVIMLLMMNAAGRGTRRTEEEKVQWRYIHRNTHNTQNDANNFIEFVFVIFRKLVGI